MEEIYQYVVIAFAIFGLSSGLLYSEGPREVREWFFNKTSQSKYWIIRKLSYLTICQLCLSVWLSLAVQWIAVPFIFSLRGAFTYFMIALSFASISWMLGAITLFFLWGKAFFEDLVRQSK